MRSYVKLQYVLYEKMRVQWPSSYPRSEEDSRVLSYMINIQQCI